MLGKREELRLRAVIEVASEKRARSNGGTGAARICICGWPAGRACGTDRTQVASEKRPQQRGNFGGSMVFFRINDTFYQIV